MFSPLSSYPASRMNRPRCGIAKSCVTAKCKPSATAKASTGGCVSPPPHSASAQHPSIADANSSSGISESIRTSPQREGCIQVYTYAPQNQQSQPFPRCQLAHCRLAARIGSSGSKAPHRLWPAPCFESALSPSVPHVVDTFTNKLARGASKGKYAFVSLGCPKNLVDSERMLGLLQLDGY